MFSFWKNSSNRSLQSLACITRYDKPWRGTYGSMQLPHEPFPVFSSVDDQITDLMKNRGKWHRIFWDGMGLLFIDELVITGGAYDQAVD